MVTGLISFFSPEYSPISSSVSVVRLSSSSFHCRPGDGVGDEDQRGRAGAGHGGRADDRLAGAAGQHDDAGAAVPEAVDGELLVVAQLPAVLLHGDLVGLAVDVAGQVLRRPADLEQRLLEPAALGRERQHRLGVEPGAEHRADLLVAHDLLEHRPVGGAQHQAVDRVVLQAQPAVAVHRVGDVDEQRVRHGVAGEAHERVDDLLGVVARGARVPQPERRQPVGVHVLGRALELGEGGDRLPALGRHRVVDLEQQGLVALDDEGSVSGHRALQRPDGSAASWSWPSASRSATPVMRWTEKVRSSCRRWSYAVT